MSPPPPGRFIDPYGGMLEHRVLEVRLVMLFDLPEQLPIHVGQVFAPPAGLLNQAVNDRALIQIGRAPLGVLFSYRPEPFDVARQSESSFRADYFEQFGPGTDPCRRAGYKIAYPDPLETATVSVSQEFASIRNFARLSRRDATAIWSAGSSGPLGALLWERPGPLRRFEALFPKH